MEQLETAPQLSNPQQILKTSSFERPKKLKEFKEQLPSNMTNVAAVLGDIATIIRYHPNAPKNILLKYFETVSVKTPLSTDQKEIIDTGFDTYLKRRQAVKQIRQKYPDDRKLFTSLFKQSPRGKIEVIVGPITLYFRCHNLQDYALIHSQAFLGNRSPSQQEVSEAELSNGVYVEGYITAEKAIGSPLDQKAQQILNHEEQHAIMNLFIQAFQEHSARLKDSNLRVPQFIRETTQPFRLTIALKLLQRDLRKADEAEKQWLIKHLLRTERRQTGERNAKDEILAYFKTGIDTYTIQRLLTTPKEEGGLYDYFNKTWKRDLAESLVKVAGEQYRPSIDQNIEDVFVREYQEMLSNSLNAVDILRQGGYPREQIVYFLIDKPLSKWVKTVQRLTVPHPRRLPLLPWFRKA